MSDDRVHAAQAATFLAQYEAVCRVRPPTSRETEAYRHARRVMSDYDLPIPESLQ